jgi:hypothetical protein
MTSSREMRPLRRSDLDARTVDGELVILDRAKGTVHRLNETASSIWNDCDGNRTTAEIAARLAERVQRTPDDVLDDVVGAIRTLGQLGLLAQFSPGEPEKAGPQQNQ